MKIASWNINSVRFRMDIVARFLKEMAPDILCLQETKAENAQFPMDALKGLGYPHIVINGQKMHHGVAILSKVPLVEDRSHDWQDNGEARHIGVRLPNGVLLENVYVPAGGDIPDREQNPKFGQKLDFLGRMIDWSSSLSEPTILTGDFNIAPLESDVWNHRQLIDVVSHTPIEVETLARLQASHNWVDLGRHFVPAPERLFTWWSYRAKDWSVSDRGRRLDHMWASPSLREQAVSHTVHEACRDWDKPSDHIPIVTEFAF
ncbi:MAG: exodeoxyribonuclease III [Sphingomonadales bacterium]|jgi:exodeoxyribonuclease-3|nr:exodeoxyribonuclease III [Sphingomonadales bacterium]MBK6720576.1 exodeoxyribonuclease III [Sphingomonadales bacterium]MBK8273760.1 exodeoxyribonuclease III [Sphingomonadales bacterium]MBK8861158.1 exodeoxyribonuclease III [Sphingomonadales bacterium]MBP7135604.1 exodeoxyribonuclease III [Sphingomonadaceae bacterium]